MQNITELSFEDKVKKVYHRISVFFSVLPIQKIAVADPLIRSYAFYKVELETLEKQIAESGVSENYRNGEGQSGMKLSTAITAHLKVQKNMQTTAVKLLNLLPESIMYSKTAKWSRDRFTLEQDFKQYIEDGDREETETFDQWRARRKSKFYDPDNYYEDDVEDDQEDSTDGTLDDLMIDAKG